MEQTNKTNLVSHQFSSIHRQKKLQRIIFSMTLANVQWGKISNVTNQFGYLKYCLVFDIPLWKIWDRQLGVFCPIYGKVKFMFQTTNQNILKCPHFQRVISAHQVNFGIHTTHFGWFRCSMCKHTISTRSPIFQNTWDCIKNPISFEMTPNHVTLSFCF